MGSDSCICPGGASIVVGVITQHNDIMHATLYYKNGDTMMCEKDDTSRDLLFTGIKERAAIFNDKPLNSREVFFFCNCNQWYCTKKSKSKFMNEIINHSSIAVNELDS